MRIPGPEAASSPRAEQVDPTSGQGDGDDGEPPRARRGRGAAFLAVPAASGV